MNTKKFHRGYSTGLKRLDRETVSAANLSEPEIQASPDLKTMCLFLLTWWYPAFVYRTYCINILTLYFIGKGEDFLLSEA